MVHITAQPGSVDQKLLSGQSSNELLPVAPLALLFSASSLACAVAWPWPSPERDGRLTTSVYRKPTHTDQYLAFDSHHPQSVKRGIVKCLYVRARRLVTKPSVISEEKKHLSSVLVSNGYPFSFLQKLTKTRRPNNSAELAIEFKATAVLPYVKGVSEQLRRSLQQQGVRAVFKSETTLRSHLVRPRRCRPG